MKKFTSLFLLFLVCFVHNLGAQTQNVTDLAGIQFSTETAKYYYKIKNVRSNKYAAYTGDNSQMAQVATATLETVFYLEEVVDATLTGKKKVKIRNVRTNNYCAEFNSFTANGTVWYLLHNATDNGLIISKNANGDGSNWDDQGNQTTIGYWHVQNDGTTWQLVPTTNQEFDQLAVASINNAKEKCAQKALLTTVNLSAKAYTDFTTTLNSITCTNYQEFNSKLTAVNQALTTYQNAVEKVYVKLLNVGRTGKYMGGNAQKPIGITDVNNASALWCVETTADKNTVTFFNAQIGKYLSAVPNADSQELTWVDRNAAGMFELKWNATKTQFAIIDPDNTNARKAIHMAGHDVLVTWGDNSDASQWKVTETQTAQSGLLKQIQAQAAQLKAKANCIKAENTVGYHYVISGTAHYNMTELNKLIQEGEGSQATETTEVLEARAAKLSGVRFEANNVAGKFFRIVCAKRSAGEIIYSEPTLTTSAVSQDNPEGIDTRGIYYNTSANVKPMAALWALEVVDDAKDRYFIKHANSGAYMGQLASVRLTQLAVSKNWAGKFLLGEYTTVPNDNNDWNLSDHVSTGTFLSTSNQNKDVNAWTDAQDQGAGWKFEEVTTFPVTIGNAKYATLNLPFGVEIAQGDKNNLKAYIGQKNSANANEFVVTEITDGIIPANTPVILHATAAATYTLNISTKTSTVTLTNNELKGTTIANHKMEKNTYYGLGVLKNGTVGFKLANTTDMAANKAYLPKPAGAQAAALSFVFEGQQTGINGVTTEEVESNVYYDLNGRRVLYPTTGLYINAKGQKVFLK